MCCLGLACLFIAHMHRLCTHSVIVIALLESHSIIPPSVPDIRELFVPADKQKAAIAEAAELPKLNMDKLTTEWLQVGNPRDWGSYPPSDVAIHSLLLYGSLGTLGRMGQPSWWFHA